MALVCYFHGFVLVIAISQFVYSPLSLPHGKSIQHPRWNLRWSFSYCTWILLESECSTL